MALDAQRTNWFTDYFNTLRALLKGGIPERDIISLIWSAEREGVEVSVAHCMVLAPDGPACVGKLRREIGSTRFTVLDETRQEPSLEAELARLLRQYTQVFGSEPDTARWEAPVYHLVFGTTVVEHHLCNPDKLVPVYSPDLVFIWMLHQEATQLKQAWVGNLAERAVILSDMMYPLLSEGAVKKVTQTGGFGGSATYQANNQFYNQLGLERADTQNAIGILRKF
jgi:hypothetical protein